METRIIFANGQQLEVEQNGNSYIVDRKPDFPEDLTNIEITGEQPQFINNGKLVECASIDGRYWFAIIETPRTEIREKEVDDRLVDIEDALCEMSKAE